MTVPEAVQVHNDLNHPGSFHDCQDPVCVANFEEWLSPPLSARVGKLIIN